MDRKENTFPINIKGLTIKKIVAASAPKLINMYKMSNASNPPLICKYFQFKSNL